MNADGCVKRLRRGDLVEMRIYLSECQWSTVRQGMSLSDDARNNFAHDQRLSLMAWNLAFQR